jgi:septin 7
LINTLFNSTLYPPKEPFPPAAERAKTVAIESIGAGESVLGYFTPVHIFNASTDIEENGVRLHLTVVDTPGFGDFVNNDDRYDTDGHCASASHLCISQLETDR